jgi:type IV secretion system protein TrbI
MSDVSTEKQEEFEPLPIRAHPPKASLALNKRTILILVIVLFLGGGLAILEGLSSAPSISAAPIQDRSVTSIGEKVRGLPNDYSSISRPKTKLGPPLNGEIGPTELAFKKEEKSLSAEERFNEEQRLQKLKQSALARSADVVFPGVRMESTGIARVGGPGETIGPAGLPSSSARDEDNRQDDKFNFLSQERDGATMLNSTLRSQVSKYQLMAGSVLPGVLLTGINSDLPGQILGQLSQNVFDSRDGKYLLLPQGTKIIGEYDSRVTYGQDRVLIVWTRLILPNGKSVSLAGMPGVDLSGYAGLTDEVDHHYVQLLTGVVFGSVLGAGAQMARGSNRSIDPTFGQLALEGTAQNINQAGQQITRKNLNIQPTIKISPGHRFSVFVTKDMVLEPYGS